MSAHPPPPFTSKRPRYHLTPPRGWMNDPCGRFQDAAATYHLYFQYVPNATETTKDIGWGHAWTHDLIHWDRDEGLCLKPSESYDQMGVWTGNLVPSSSSSKKDLIAIYTAVNAKARSPDYTNGQELLALATSSDNGRSWIKSPNNPLPVRPPPNVTGWRDPFLSPWLRLSHLLSLPPDTIYLMISGGLRDLGPTLFLYSLHPNADPSSKEGWTYLGPLIRPTISPARPRSSWTGDRGWNWECSSFFEVEERSVAVLSAEGYFREKLPEEEVDPAVVEKGAEPEKNPRWQLWFAGPLSSPARSREGATKAHRRGTAEMDIKLEGVLDWGDLYAAQTFLDNSGRRLMWGWLPDDDLPPALRAERGWTGAISLPRELFWQAIPDVIGTLHSRLEDLPGFEVEASGHTKVVRTLGIRPPVELEAMRGEEMDLSHLKMTPSAGWEAELVGDVTGYTEVGLILSFPHGEARVRFRPDDERIIAYRSLSTTNPSILTVPEIGKLTLFRTPSGLEPLHLRVYFDATLLEVFANDRFALSAHLYGGDCSVSPYTIPDRGEREGRLRARAWQFKGHTKCKI